MKKIVTIFIIMLAVFIIVVLIIGSSIEVEFYFNELRSSFVDDYIDLGDNKEESVVKLSEYFNVKRDIAEKMYDNPSEYGLLILDYTVKNNSPFKIRKFKFSKSLSKFGMYLIDDYFDDLTLRSINPYSSMTHSAVGVIIEKPSEFKTDILNDLKFRMYNFHSFGLSLSINSTYMGFSTPEQINILEADSDLKDIANYQAFFTMTSPNENYTLDSSYNELTKSAVRICENLYYRFLPFEDDGVRRYGFTFFNEDKSLIGGVLLNKILKKVDFNDIEIDKSTFNDVLLIDKGACIFEEAESLVTYHYFDDLSYLKLSYKQEGKLLVVDKIEYARANFNWISILTQQDYALISQPEDGSMC